MRITHITRNIPVRTLKGNDVILKILKANEKYSSIEQNIIFPAEYVPNIPFIRGRLKTFSELRGECFLDSVNLIFANFIRFLPPYDFLFSGCFFDKKKIISFAADSDCLHAHYIYPDGAIAKEISSILHVPYILSVRQGDVDRLNKLSKGGYYWNKYSDVLKGAAKIISVNESIKNYIFNNFGFCSDCIPHGIGEELLSNKTTSMISSRLRVVTCGQFIARKNIDWVIKACNEFSDKLDLTVIGEGELNEYYRSLSDKARFVSNIGNDSVINLFLDADVFILPSDRETFGMVFIEAAASGCLIIGKKGTGVDGYFTDGVNALFVNDYNDLVHMLKRILEKSFNWQKIADNGVNNVSENLTWRKVSSLYKEAYIQAINNVV